MDNPTVTNQPGWFTRTYAYSSTIPHAVSSVTSEQSAVDSYTYDANGNPSTGSGRRMTCRIENGVVYTHTYNAENRASSIAKRNTDCTGTIIESWSFAYDGDGVRVSTAHFTGTSGSPDSTTSYYMGGQFEVKDGATKKYYSIAGMMVAVNDGSAVQYLLTDHLGSTVAVTNASGTLTSQQRYLPFGEERAIPNSPILATDFGYTGQRLLDSGMGGIMDYRARFYSPALGRFLQPDTVIPGADNPQSWNRYSYVHNNPVKYNDPTGHWLETAWDIANIVWDIAEVRKDPSAINIGALILDVAAAILPVVPAGAGLLARGAKLASKADDIADLSKAADKTYSVYRAVKNGVTEYVGITTDYWRRSKELEKIGRVIEPIMEKLSKYDAHAVEQVLIEKFGRIEKEVGGTLSNINNSISKSKQYYEEAIGHGVDLLDEIVPQWSIWK